MTAQVISLPRKKARLECSACGASSNADCDCGVPYVPAGTYAAAAIAANPRLSNVAIASAIGVSHETIRRARQSTSTNVEVDKRIGRDGIERKLPKPKKKYREDPKNHLTVFLLRCDQAAQLAYHSGKVKQDAIDAAHSVVRAWNKLIKKLEATRYEAKRQG